MAITLYGLKNCDTCKKAMKAIAAAGRDVRFVDIRAEADLPTLLPVWIQAIGKDAIVNTRSTTWRTLSSEEKTAVSDNLIALLTANPTLVKRPIIDANGDLTSGWNADIEGRFRK